MSGPLDLRPRRRSRLRVHPTPDDLLAYRGRTVVLSVTDSGDLTDWRSPGSLGVAPERRGDSGNAVEAASPSDGL